MFARSLLLLLSREEREQVRKRGERAERAARSGGEEATSQRQELTSLSLASLADLAGAATRRQRHYPAIYGQRSLRSARSDGPSPLFRERCVLSLPLRPWQPEAKLTTNPYEKHHMRHRRRSSVSLHSPKQPTQRSPLPPPPRKATQTQHPPTQLPAKQLAFRAWRKSA